jgi:hypothetical protein
MQMWIVKTDASGSQQWNRDFGGTGFDDCRDIVLMQDGGYMIAGCKDLLGNGDCDMWLLRISSAGDSLWSRTFGGPGDDRCYSLQQTSDGGWVMAGLTSSYGAGNYDFWVLKTDVNGDSLWSHTFGGGGADGCNSVRQTMDGGYVLAGWNGTYGPSNDDYWLIKLDANGNYQWDRTLGWIGNDRAYTVRQTLSGGYLLCGYSYQGGAPGYELWLEKTDGHGSPEWSCGFGGGNEEDGLAFEQTFDGGFIFAGFTDSFDSGGGQDMWLVRTGPEILPPVPQVPPGTLWTQTHGGSGDETAMTMIESSDQGYVMAGATRSFTAGSDDFWLLKTDSDGDSLWSNRFGGGGSEWCSSVIETQDGGFALAGNSSSFTAGGSDMWLVKTNSAGDSTWAKRFGGSSNDDCFCMIQTSDYGYALAGYSVSFSAGGSDFWLVKTNANGDSLWSRRYGGSGNEECEQVLQTSDGGYVLAGFTTSFGSGWRDYWIVKTNSVGDSLWSRTYGGINYETATQIALTPDGGYLLSGHAAGSGGVNKNIWLVKTDSAGNLQWSRLIGTGTEELSFSLQSDLSGGYVIAGVQGPSGSENGWLVRINENGDSLWSQTYGGGAPDEFYSVIHVSDGSYVIAGYSQSSGAGGRDFWLVKTQAEASPYRIQWTDTTGGSWFDWNNWNPARIPEANDTVFITRSGDYSVTIPANAEVGQFILGSGLPDDTTVQTLSVLCNACSLSVNDNSLINYNGQLTADLSASIVLANNALTLTDSGEVALADQSSLHLGSTNTFDIAEGKLTLSDDADITNGGLVRNSGSILRNGLGTSTINANYQDTAAPEDTSLIVNGGTLFLDSPDSTIVISNVAIAPGAELALTYAQFEASATVSGEGTLTLEEGNSDLAAAFPFHGNLTLAGGTLNFHPPAIASLDTLRIESGTNFSSTVALNVSAARMSGSTISANLNINNRFDWSAGQYLGSPGSSITINPGVDLFVSGPASKSLNTRNLVIDGAADISGSGVFTLINGSSITVGSGGTLLLGDSVTISAPLDSLINQGEITIQTVQDTCILDLFLWNNPAGRTPGTVDILSDSKATFRRARNDGTIKLREHAHLSVVNRFINNALSDMGEGSVCFMNDSLLNLPSGTLYLAGDAAITGTGVIENSGSIYRRSGASRTPSLCNITTEFHNLSGTGYLAVEVDTLALTNPVADNAGVINIYTDATLQVASTFENLPGGVIQGGGDMSIVIRNLTIVRQGNSVQLLWTRVPGEVQYYDIYRATLPSEDLGQYSVIGRVYYDEETTVYSYTTPMGSREKAFYRVVIVR